MSKNIVEEQRLLSVSQAATYLGVSVSTIYGWTSRGKHSVDPFPTIHISSRCIRFDRDQIRAWLNRRCNSGTPEMVVANGR